MLFTNIFNHKNLRNIVFQISLIFMLMILISCHKPNIESNNLATSKQLSLPENGEEIVVINTNMGTIKIKLFEEIAPESITYFKSLISSNHYENSTFSRIEKNIANQVDYELTYPDNKEDKKPYQLETSLDYKHISGAVSMVFQNGFYQSQSFLIVVGGGISNEDLDAMAYLGESEYPSDVIEAYKKVGGYPEFDGMFTVIGQVFEGMDVVVNINNVEVVEKVDINSYKVPIEPIIIEEIMIEKYLK